VIGSKLRVLRDLDRADIDLAAVDRALALPSNRTGRRAATRILAAAQVDSALLDWFPALDLPLPLRRDLISFRRNEAEWLSQWTDPRIETWVDVPRTTYHVESGFPLGLPVDDRGVASWTKTTTTRERRWHSRAQVEGLAVAVAAAPQGVQDVVAAITGWLTSMERAAPEHAPAPATPPATPPAPAQSVAQPAAAAVRPATVTPVAELARLVNSYELPPPSEWASPVDTFPLSIERAAELAWRYATGEQRSFNTFEHWRWPDGGIRIVYDSEDTVVSARAI